MSKQDATSTAPAQTPGRHGRDGYRRRGMIVELAADLFDREGYHQTSMEMLADAAGIAKPTIYHYFPGKDSILQEIHQSFIILLTERHTARLKTKASPSELISGIMMDILGSMETHRGHVRVFFENHRDLPDDKQQQVRLQRDEYYQMVRQVINKGIEIGEFRPVDSTIATAAIFGVCNWVYQWYSPDGPMGSRKVAERLWDLISNGLLEE